MCQAAEVRQALEGTQLPVRARGEATPGKLAGLLRRGRDNTIRGLLQTEYALDQPTASRVLEALQGLVMPLRLSAGRRRSVLAATATEDRGYAFTIRLPDAGESWIQAGYAASAERLFVVSLEVAARYRRNGFSTGLLAAAIRHAEESRGVVNYVKGEAGGTNYRILRTPGCGIADTPFAKSLDQLGFATAYDTSTNEMLASRRS